MPTALLLLAAVVLGCRPKTVLVEVRGMPATLTAYTHVIVGGDSALSTGYARACADVFDSIERLVTTRFLPESVIARIPVRADDSVFRKLFGVSDWSRKARTFARMVLASDSSQQASIRNMAHGSGAPAAPDFSDPDAVEAYNKYLERLAFVSVAAAALDSEDSIAATLARDGIGSLATHLTTIGRDFGPLDGAGRIGIARGKAAIIVVRSGATIGASRAVPGPSDSMVVIPYDRTAFDIAAPCVRFGMSLRHLDQMLGGAKPSTSP